MTFQTWKRAVTRTVLVTFTSALVSCGGTGDEPYAADTAGVEATSTMAPTTFAPTTAPPPSLPTEAPEQLGKEQLRELVAPVALYPDVVLASLLPATTQPEQLHEAAEYIGDAARVEQVPEDRGWDGSVVGMLQFPDVVRWLDDNPAWTEQMGQAVTYQQADVLEAIQDFRRAARDVGNLKSNQYQTVRSDPDQDIRIEPAQPDVVYVPSYDPEAATQPQPAERQGINPWIAFGGGAIVGALGAWALYSIFDDDDDDDDDDDRRYGRRRIRRYDNYYYARGRRPRQVAWDAPQRHRFVRPERVQRPARLRHETPAGQPRKKAAALRPPTSAQPRPGQVRQQQQQEKRQERQQNQRQQREAQQGRRQEQREQRQQRQQQRQEQKQQQQQQRQERRQEQRPQQGQQQGQAEPRPRQQRQEQRQERRQEQREQRQQQQQQRQDRREERQEQRQGQRQQQQQKRQERREERQDNRRKRRNPDAAQPGARNQPQPDAAVASRAS